MMVTATFSLTVTVAAGEGSLFSLLTCELPDPPWGRWEEAGVGVLCDRQAWSAVLRLVASASAM